MGSLVIEGQCSDLQSLVRLWKDYHSGVLNEAAERFLVTDEIETNQFGNRQIKDHY